MHPGRAGNDEKREYPPANFDGAPPPPGLAAFPEDRSCPVCTARDQRTSAKHVAAGAQRHPQAPTTGVHRRSDGTTTAEADKGRLLWAKGSKRAFRLVVRPAMKRLNLAKRS